MTLTLDLSPQLEQRLQQEAAKAGVPAAQFVLKTLEERLPRPDPKKLIELLDAWNEEDATEDPAELRAREAEWEEFKAALNESHSSYRKIFP